ncbi:MAG: D-alanyl-D-alanine carboxypeptidase/D-alanyl-D-alanine-endopeptidase [Melioribacteraceae bacterium]|nr:D-alanyl-D-alanine carboxypeptidase/D-alanyl-D-alanine-endopeptidase [Melioribacteraceae bacterium]
MKIFLKSIFLLLIISSINFSQVVKKDSLQKNINTLQELRDQLDDFFGEQNFSNAFWGVMVKSLKTGEIIYKRNADKLFIPASNIKLFTSAAALIILGSKYKYQTDLLANGILLRGTLKGDLIIQGSGDPTISNRFIEGSVTKIFENWADSLKAKGIYEITGNIYGDDSFFDNNDYGRGWLSDYENNWYAAPSSALSFNNNTIQVVIEPTQINFPAKIYTIPNTNFVSIISSVFTKDQTKESNISINRIKGTNIIQVKGNISITDKSILKNVPISNPSQYFLTVLKETFERKGIIIRGRTGVISEDKINIDHNNLIPLLSHYSVQMKYILKEMNKNSNNFYAEQILKTIGLEENDYGTIQNGVDACVKYFNQMGINMENLVLADGSGLSRLNLVTPRQIVNLLTFMYKHEEFEKFYDSLPIAGVDGTLIDRMQRTIAENNVRAKPGYIDNVSALSGYLKTISGETLAFSMIANNFLAPPVLANYIQDSVCQRLINFNRN